MTALCLGLVVLAVLWGIGPPAGRELRDRLAPDPPVRRRPGREALQVVGVLVATPLVVGLAVLLGGPRAGVLTLTAIVVVLTVIGQLRQRVRTRAALRAQMDVAHACAVLAAHLRVGQVPAEALAVAAADCPVLDRARQVHDVGGDPAAVWAQQARRPGCGGLLELSRAWRVSRRTGAPLSATLEQVARSLSAEQSVRSMVAGELAAPRASGKVMAALPACGIGMGYLLGGDPLAWLLAGPAGWVCVLAGVGLACAGVAWIELLARRASAPPTSPGAGGVDR